MTLWWLLGVLAVALCEGNDAIDIISANSTTVKRNETTTRQKETPGQSKNVTKRQAMDIKIGETLKGVVKEEGMLNNLEGSYRPQEKRAKFSSWAGKRGPDDSQENKRAKFSSWAGKRTPEENVDPPEYSKRTKFSSWAGKRDKISEISDKRNILAQTLASNSLEDDAMDYFNTPNEEKRGRFSSWGGKRGDASYENKRKFSSWSGKRSYLNPTTDLVGNLLLLESQNVHLPEYPEYLIPNNDLEQGKSEISEKIGELLHLNVNPQESIDLKGIIDVGNDIEEPEYWRNSDWDLDENKRGRFSSWGGKRKFSSWGGKRDGTDLPEAIEGVDKRAKFSSWAGKRGTFPFWKSKYQGKRGKFSSWAGKRSDNSFDYQEEDKRGKFSSWGGKRSFDDTNMYDEKRTKFSSWAGKRFDNEDDEGINMDKRDKYLTGLKQKLKGRGFSSWGGKRSYSEDDGKPLPTINDKNNYDWDTLNKIKRGAKFSSWAGKRNQLDDEMEKRKFSSWGGKRNYFEFPDEPKRAKFSSWAGKRSVNPNDGPDVDKRKENRKSGLLRRYNRFNSWRGKKDNIAPLNGTKLTRLEDVDFNQSGDSLRGNKSKRGFSNYFRQFELIKRNPLLRAWIGKHYPDFPLMTWKRRPGFSSWGGKRSGSVEISEEPEQSFADKRGRFSSWGGKRAHNLDKRSVPMTQQFLQDPKLDKNELRTINGLATSSSRESQRFYVRNSKDGLLTPVVRPIRRQFYAWGGKRAHNS